MIGALPVMKLPTPVPEIPTSNIDEAAAYYVKHLGFTLDWGGEEGGIAGDWPG